MPLVQSELNSDKSFNLSGGRTFGVDCFPPEQDNLFASLPPRGLDKIVGEALTSCMACSQQFSRETIYIIPALKPRALLWNHQVKTVKASFKSGLNHKP